jgi:hypothetical protein
MRRALVAAITLASTAALVSGATVTAAQASEHAASQHRTSDRRSSEHFRIISTSARSRRQSVLATGAFLAGGYQVPGRVVGLRATDKMVYPSGTFLVARHITRQWLPLPTSACLIRETIRGTYSLSHGTGAYRGISGSGGFAVRINGVLHRSRGRCGGAMTVFQEITYEGGSVRR